jgi:two-component system response regulator YesN
MIRTIIVDDEQWTRDIIKRFGSWDKYDMEIVGEAGDGLDAVQLIKSSQPQLVITDMNMPGIDGTELLKFLNEHYPQMKVIVVSGYDDFMYTKQAIRYKVNEYLLKPIDAVELNNALLKCKEELETSSHSQHQQVSFNAEVFKKLKPYKLLLSVHYNELNIEGVRSTFADLLNNLNPFESLEESLLNQVDQDLLVHLKELMVSNSLELNQVVFDMDNKSFSSGESMIERLTELYLLTLHLLIQQRKYKNKLNLDEIKTFIDRNYAEQITLEKIARSFFVSKEYLSKAFKLEFHQNITDYTQNVRMEKAREWLLHDQIPIKKVAEMCGYEEIAYFYRVFKKHYGVAPGEMRKETN